MVILTYMDIYYIIYLVKVMFLFKELDQPWLAGFKSETDFDLSPACL